MSESEKVSIFFFKKKESTYIGLVYNICTLNRDESDRQKTGIHFHLFDICES